ncbi:MAG: anthranilate synthase component II [Acidimicrobiales bacterium]|jgi:anthranilate synthase/aminodeoxychorismate synthase-like glutamine amidotransferase
MSTVLVIDNYDSFTYNLVQYLGELGASVVVHRNDAIGIAAVESLGADGIVISPGPCTPDSAGISVELVRRFAGTVPVLGVCLGHQAIGAAFGARVVRNHRILHGKTSEIHHSAVGVLSDLPNPFVAGRYHSLVIEASSLPDELDVTAWTDQGEIMGIRHREHDVTGVQFHPESVLTPDGKQLLANWLGSVGGRP